MELGHTLVIRPGALGDAILTLPALHALRLAGAKGLTVLGTPASWGFLKQTHEGVRVRDFSSVEWLGLFARGATLGEPAKAALAQTSTAILYLPEAEQVKAALSEHGVRNTVCIEPPVAGAAAAHHASSQLLDPLWPVVGEEFRTQARKILNQSHDGFLVLDEQERCRALDRLGLDAPPEGGFVAIHPGSGGVKKCWPAERFAKLATELSCRHSLVPLVFFGPADERVRAQFESSMPPGVHWELADNRPLREALALLTHARACVGNDSGMTHLAARACPTLAIFGPTDPRVWSPLGQRVQILQAANGELDKLSVQDVLEKAMALL